MNSDTEERPFALRALEKSEETVKALCALENVCFSCPWSEKLFEEAFDNPFTTLFGLYAEGALAGYAVLFVFFEEAEVQNLAVRADGRRKGMGRALLDACLQEAQKKGAERIYLEVRQSNDAARRLYEKASFEYIGRRKNYYRFPTEDALIMARALGKDDHQA